MERKNLWTIYSEEQLAQLNYAVVEREDEDGDEEYVVLELGMSSLGEISYLSNIIKPDIAVITMIGTSHIEKLGSRENILKAKMEIRFV